MVDVLTVRPSSIRGLGNITLVRELSDFTLVNCTLTRGTVVVNGLTENTYTMVYEE